MPTIAEIRNKVAIKLGVLSIGGTLSNRYVDDLDNAYNEVYAELKELDLVSWTSTGDIPDKFVEPIVSLVARSRLDEYGIGNDRYARIVNSANGAHARIRALLKPSYFKSSQDAEYY